TRNGVASRDLIANDSNVLAGTKRKRLFGSKPRLDHIAAQQPQRCNRYLSPSVRAGVGNLKVGFRNTRTGIEVAPQLPRVFHSRLCAWREKPGGGPHQARSAHAGLAGME